MPSPITQFRQVRLSLADLLGDDYMAAVCAARACTSGDDPQTLRAIADEKVDFYPRALHDRLLALLPRTGQLVCPPLVRSAKGATTESFRTASRTQMAPLAGLGCFRVTEDGRLFLISKSEHYHAPLGHGFAGYRLAENARRLGIPNATHNNTRGHITRLLEQELIRTANGLADSRQLDDVLASTRPGVLNRALNLETGSLAAEAALKMVLARFYKSQPDVPEPTYAGRTPVLLVVGDDEGALQANYHGTTIVAQAMRGMWPELLAAWQQHDALRIRAVRPNRFDDVERAFAEDDRGHCKIAGFFHEIVMMNYGGRLLSKEFLQRTYELCRRHDVATVVDEIQSVLWHPDLYMFREYGLEPDFVVIGKGCTGGEYAASRVLFGAAYDSLPQFGALVTNGQEEIASLIYLISMRWAQANADVTRPIGDYFQQRLRDFADKHPSLITTVDGSRHLAGICFAAVEPAKAFAAALNDLGIDISVQTYKTTCPPAALIKPPLIAGYEVIDLLRDRMQAAIEQGAPRAARRPTDK